MKIVGLVNKDSGCGFHRIIMPLLLMPGVDVYITNAVKEEDFIGCDWVYYNRHTSDSILDVRHKYNFKVAVDVDDFWNLDHFHIAYQDYQTNKFHELQVKHLELADVVTTTHERLAEMIYPHNRNVIVCPNAIPDHEYFSFEKTESKFARIFWQGSITHEKDIELLRGPFSQLDHNKFMSVIAGFNDHPTWHKMVRYFTDSLRLKGAVLPGCSPFEYYKNYQYADICVAPLVESKFNSFKSNLKILEAAHAGLPIVVSQVHPYLDMPVLYAKGREWFKQVNTLGHKPELRRELGANLKEYCSIHFNFNKINQIRMQSAFGATLKTKVA